MKWIKTMKIIKPISGNTTIRYRSRETDRVIESRKVAIPHANRPGSWYHTSYFLIYPDGTEKEYLKMADAKAAAEAE